MSTLTMQRAEVTFSFGLAVTGGSVVSITAKVPYRDTATNAVGVIEVSASYTGAQLAGVSLQDAWDALKPQAESLIAATGSGGHTVVEGP